MEAKPHLHELELTGKALKAAAGFKMLLDGGSGKKVLIPEKLSNYMRPSIDIDVIMPDADACKAFSGMEKGKMVDKVKLAMVEGKLGYENITYYSPFPVYRDKAYPDTDIFIPSGGLGPIPFGKDLFVNAIDVRMDQSEMDVRVADIAFTLATSINPLVFTNTRARGALVALFSNTSTFDIPDTVASTANYLLKSMDRVNSAMVIADSARSLAHMKSDKNYKQYARIISEKIPNKLDALEGKVSKIVAHVNVDGSAVRYGLKEFRYGLEGLEKL
ncbi:MAG: hypothetical protein QXR73_01185, partial [Candidatus Micrarchaeaceae archaeon]